ncbi:WXG100 family type VII secretion target [Metabacillus arenae]|uniref:WXG100 family type VII secretion target n=1 Tax=Metabacillus arenae TaxID=2771434 RepID=UPI001CD0834F|nr:WXG100 family type VII secretion target [Metabacillus arenae]
MNEIQIYPEQLQQLSTEINKAEQKASEAAQTLTWHYSSLLMNLSGGTTGAIEDLKDELKHAIHQYKDCLDTIQILIHRTRTKMEEEDQRLAAQINTLSRKLTFAPLAVTSLLSMNPVTDRLKNTFKAGQAAAVHYFGESFQSFKNVLSHEKIIQSFQTAYLEIVNGPLGKTRAYLREMGRKIGEFKLTFSSINTIDGGSASTEWTSEQSRVNYGKEEEKQSEEENPITKVIK